jgi:hypothetical protein
VPFLPARPGRPRPLRVAAVGLLGLAVGVGATLAAGQLGGGEPAASVRRLDLPAGGAAAGAGAAGLPPGRAVAEARPVAAGTARAAVERFLTATARGDFGGAYRLLDGPSRRRYPSAARWTRAQADRPEVTGVRVGAARPVGGRTDGSGGTDASARGGSRQAVDVTVELAHPAAIDPFAGLVPARTVEVWRARSEGGGWRVAADPVSVRAELPSDRRAPDAVTAWVQRLLGCDRQGAAALQAAAAPYGPADLAEAPCRRRGRWTVAAPRRFDAAVEPEPYVAAFGPEVAAWARLVPVQGPGIRFNVVVGPLGDAWRVLGTDPQQPTR